MAVGVADLQRFFQSNPGAFLALTSTSRNGVAVL
jgi:hypothetical protein